MAMQFYQAGRSQAPDFMRAETEQARLANELRAQKQAEKLGYYSGGMQLAEMAPEGAWSQLGQAVTPGAAGAAGTAGSGGAVATDLATGAVASMTPEAAGLGSTLAGVEGASALGTGAAGAGSGAGTGIMSALGSLGPVGWAALAALGLGLATQ